MAKHSEHDQHDQPRESASEPRSNDHRQEGHSPEDKRHRGQARRTASGATATRPQAHPDHGESPQSRHPMRKADEYDVYGARNGTAASALPINPHSGQPLQPMAQPGYYPGYSTLSQQNFWDEATRNVVLARVNRVPTIRFFTAEEVPLMEAVVARILPQDDRDEQHKIPVVDYIDERLASGRIDGYRYAGMPDDWAAHRLGLKGIEACAQHVYGRAFVELTPHEQDTILESIHDGHPAAGGEYWKQMTVRHFWLLLVQDVLEAYYAHPYAWDEIGFGGPAYPRGYMRLHGGEPEPWEKDEHRYAWGAPHGSLSDNDSYVGREDPLQAQLSGKTNIPGQEGTH